MEVAVLQIWKNVASEDTLERFGAGFPCTFKFADPDQNSSNTSMLVERTDWNGTRVIRLCDLADRMASMSSNDDMDRC